MKPEQSIQNAFCAYVRLNHPDIIFTSDASGLAISVGQRIGMTIQRSAGKIPDFIMLEPNKEYHGLVIEFKTEECDIQHALASSAKRYDHIKSQYETLKRLGEKGYKAIFACGYKEALEIFLKYTES